jgi:hypothetical protein
VKQRDAAGTLSETRKNDATHQKTIICNKNVKYKNFEETVAGVMTKNQDNQNQMQLSRPQRSR